MAALAQESSQSFKHFKALRQTVDPTSTTGYEGTLCYNETTGHMFVFVVSSGKNPAGYGTGSWVDTGISQGTTMSSLTPSTYRDKLGKITLKAGSTTIGSGNGSLVGTRGEVNVPSGATLAGGFMYGVQGKMIIGGTLNNGSGFNAGLFGQLDMSAITAHTSGYLAPLICDFSTASALATDTLADMMVMLNTSQCAINSILKTEAKASFLLDLNDLGQGAYIVTSAVGGSQNAKLKIKANGTTYYIPLNTA